MPIVSRALTKLANREDIGPGVKCWRVAGVDGRGTGWVYGPFLGTQIEAEAIRDTAAWAAAQLEDEDERQGIEWILAGNAVEAFAREDLTLTEWRRRVARKWWNIRIDDRTPIERKFLCLVASYIAGFTANQIATALGISVAMAQKGLDRAIDLRDNVCPAMTASDGNQETV